MERAMAIETASGRPSGIDTIKITTAIMAIFPSSNRVAFENSTRSLKKIRPSKKVQWVATLRIQATKE